MKTLRCFIAIALTADIHQRLEALQEEMARQVPARAVRWVDPENIHLTLRFLGDTETGSIGRIGGLLEEAASTVSPFTMRLGKLGCFPNPRRPRVIWLGVQHDADALIRLQQGIELGLVAMGWPAENRRFHPHLTLGRVKDSRQVVDARYPWGQAQTSGEQKVGEICLFESDLQPAGAVYTVLKRAALGVARVEDD